MLPHVQKTQTSSDLHPSLSYDDAPSAIAFLCRAYGFEQKLVVPAADGGIAHSELALGTAVVLVSSSSPAEGRVSPRSLAGGRAHAINLCIADPQSHLTRAAASGARIIRPLQTEAHGATGYLTEDIEGHLWYFSDYRPGAFWK